MIIEYPLWQVHTQRQTFTVEARSKDEAIAFVEERGQRVILVRAGISADIDSVTDPDSPYYNDDLTVKLAEVFPDWFGNFTTPRRRRITRIEDDGEL